MRKTIFIVISWIALMAVNGVAATEVMTWKDCAAEAKKNHPDLVSAQAFLDRAKASQLLTQSTLFPQITTSLSADSSRASTGTEVETYSYSLTGQQLLFDGFKTSSNIKAALESIKSAEFNYILVASNVRNRLRVAFAKLLKAQELIMITEKIYTRRNQNMEMIQLRYDVGREHRGSLLTSQADLKQAEFEVVQAKRNISLAQRRLIKELGRRQFSPIFVEGSFSTVSSSREKPGFEKLREDTPFLKKLIAARKEARFDLKSAKAEFSPSISLNANVGRTSSRWPPKGESRSVGVNVTFPLFEGGGRFASVQRTQALLSQARADEQSGRDRVIFSLEGDWVAWQDAIDNVLVKEKFLEAAEERSKIAEAQYANGLLSFDNWTIIEDSLVSSQKLFLNAQEQALVSEANWILTLGGAFKNDE